MKMVHHVHCSLDLKPSVLSVFLWGYVCENVELLHWLMYYFDDFLMGIDHFSFILPGFLWVSFDFGIIIAF